MTPASPLPLRFQGAPFLVREALDSGISRGRLRSADLAQPFRGVRASAADGAGVEALCHALGARLTGATYFSHSTAALIMGIPLPLSIEKEAAIHVSVFDPARAPVIRGVVSHQMTPFALGRLNWHGLRITSPVFTWCLLAEQLSIPDLVAAADFLVTGETPLATLDQLHAGVDQRAGRRGVRRLEQALTLVRVGPLSRPESHARLLYVAAGIPEPELNVNVYDTDGRFVAMLDLAWRTQEVANEYEGSHHQERGQFRRDILRRERVEDLGWRLSRFTADDLNLRPRETITRMADRLGLSLSPVRVSAAVELSRRFAVDPIGTWRLHSCGPRSSERDSHNYVLDASFLSATATTMYSTLQSAP